MRPSTMFNSLRVYWIYFLLLVFWDLCLCNEVTQRCKDKSCRVEAEDATSNDLRCNTTCRQQQCFKGCALWGKALLHSCLTTCGNSSSQGSVKMQFCMLGCQTAVDVYEQDLQEKLGEMRAPFVKRRTNTTVLLRWNGKQVPNVTYRLQLHYVQKDSDEWVYHRTVRWAARRGWVEIRVNSLHPFTEYQFRVVVLLSDSALVTSPPSVPIVTEPSGAPLVAPSVTSLTCSATTIHIRWSPPFFKNAKIISYKLTLRERNGSVPKVKAISGTSAYTILTMLQPSTEYELRIAARNTFGLGPETRNFISTLPKEESFGVTPFLLMGSNHCIRQKNLEETQRVSSAVVHNDSISQIVDVAIHYYKNYIFFTNKSGEVYRLSRTSTNSPITIHRSSQRPGPISVDWLHDRIYIAEDSAIISCNLDGSSCSVVLDNLPSRPSHIVADPFNGYLFWSHNEPQGIYKIDLASLGTSISDLTSYSILSSNQSNQPASFSTFTLDFANYRLYYPDSSHSILLSVNLDGTDQTNVRPEGSVQKTQFKNITSLAIYDGRFYWTNGSKVWFEEYDVKNGLYHHNTLYLFDDPFTGFNIWHPSAQPIPVPLQKPRHVQAVFSSQSTTLQWSRPYWDQGRGAWQDWFYEVEAQDLLTTTSKKVDNVTMSHQQVHLRITDLQPQTPYSFRVRAYTTAGYGPWSDPFIGETLKDDGSHPHLLYSCSGYIYQVGLDGADYMDMLELDPRHGIKQLIIINGWYLWLNREYKLYIKRGLAEPQRLANIDDALVIAYDWLGEKLYWWNSRNQISRHSLTGRDPVENVYQGFSQAHHLCLDSVEGYMYWATANAVEVSHLNYADHHQIASLPQFDNHILGLALDLDQRFLYWLVKENQKTLVYRAPLLSRSQTRPGNVVKLAELEDPAPPSIQGMYYYSNRLFWLSSDGSVVVMNTKDAHNVAKLELPSGSKIESLTLVQPIQGIPSESENTTVVGRSILVIPDPIQPSTVNVSGPWYAFNISWQPTPVQHGDVIYQLLLTFGQNRQISKRTSESYLVVSNESDIHPFMPIQLSMESCTYWGCSPRSQRDLFTPMAVPSPPRNPRGFVSFRRSPLSSDYTVEVELHWSPPEHSNGRLSNYTVTYQRRDGTWTVARVNPNTTFYRQDNASKYHVYKFRASSCNEKGCSKQSDEVLIDTSKENPVPRLITATDSSIDLFLPDAQVSAELWNRSTAVALTFEAQESALYLLDKSSHILKLVEVKGHEIVGVSGQGKSIAMDWVGRDLYWLEEEPQGYCEIRTYNLDRGDTASKRVLQMDKKGSNLAVHPYKSAIFWSVAYNDGSGHIMRSYMNGTHERSPVIGHPTRGLGYYNGGGGRRKRAAPGCHCPSLTITSTFTMDHSRAEHGEIYVVENGTGSIWAADLNQCNCRLVVNATSRPDLGLPPDSMAIDHQRLYWSNLQQAMLHSVLKGTGAQHYSEPMGGVKQIVAIGRHLQPFPDPKCLKTDNYHQPPKIKYQTNTTLTVTLGKWRPPTDCAHISLPRTRYTVHYRNATTTNDVTSCLKAGSVCKTKVTYDTEVSLTGLEPHKYYYLQVVADNFYTRDEHKPSSVAYAIMITAPGVPSAPRDVKADVRTPESAMVTWRAPAVSNGRLDDVEFEVRWWKLQTTGPIHRDDVNASDEEYTKGSFQFIVNKLQPKSSYNFKVVAYYRRDRLMGESRSDTSTTTTYPVPPLVELRHATSRNITVSWTAPTDVRVDHHRIVLKPVTKEGEPVVEPIRGPEYSTISGVVYNETFNNLQPNTEYALVIKATYKISSTFLWPHDPHENTAKTAPGRPRRPEAPEVELVHAGDQPHIVWTPPNDGGEPIDEYRLMARRSRPNEMNWTLVYNGTETHWIVTDLETDMSYVFSVTAHNVKGWSAKSLESEPMTYKTSIAAVTWSADHLTNILAVSFTVIVLTVIFFAAVIFGSRLLKKHKPVPVDFVNPSPRADVELAILRDLPRNTRQHTNTLYAINIVPTEEDVAALPHFRRDCLVLTKFLGSGAFGEVFEGVAKDILGPNTGDIRVAVKTLRKGASRVEKEEFLKEALLMDNFTHTHILHLLGVCLQNDPQFIILELMEGGDLLSYLRNARPTHNRPPRLTMTDMVAICTDVAKGCKYLEDMHFVHRDLAARNCLVSSLDPALRVVKIGDFGLARDIYKNDYYRKEGEGLLPVRWMSPESLIDGVFTTYSDVWAFGVLMWEVLTLGQQPYPARTNIEVLNYVRGGGRLDRPDHCHQDLHSVMLKCWCFSPGGRPSFSYLLSELESIKLPGTEASNHYTTTGLHACEPVEKFKEDEPVVYSSVNCDNSPKPIEYTELSRNAQGNPTGRQVDGGSSTPSTRQGHGSDMCRAPSSSIARPRPVARPDHSPYLQPVSHTGGPNKYLELVADEEGSSGGGGASSPASHHPASGLHYAQLSSTEAPAGPWIESPDLHSRHPACQSGTTKKNSAIDYAQLALSDEGDDNGVDTDNEDVSSDVPSHSSSSIGLRPHHCGHPTTTTTTTTSTTNSRPPWSSHRHNTQYAQIASTDSDTDSEIYDRSRSQSHSRDLPGQDSCGSAAAAAALGPAAAVDGATLSCDDIRSKFRPGWLAGQREGDLPSNRLAPYTIDGYLAPRSLQLNNKQGLSSSSINSNNTTSSHSTC